MDITCICVSHRNVSSLVRPYLPTIRMAILFTNLDTFLRMTPQVEFQDWCIHDIQEDQHEISGEKDFSQCNILPVSIGVKLLVVLMSPARAVRRFRNL